MSGEPQTIEGEATEVDEIRDNLPAVRAHAAVVARDEISVPELLEQRDKIVQAMQQAMKTDVHYGRIPGVNKPTLLKPGAELLNVLFRLAPSYQSERTFHDDGHLTVVSYCTLTHIPSGLVISGGEGLCSTRESKYAYRQGQRVCPTCGVAAIIKGKAEYGGGWVCFKKKDGCGAKFDDDDPVIVSQQVGRIPNEDLADSFNTVLKMADKRALVAAVLNGTAASDVFTQDVEDSGSGAADVAASSGDPGAQSGSPARAPAPAATAAVSMPDAFKGDNGTRIMEALNHTDPSVDWAETWEGAIVAHFGRPGAQLNQTQTKEAWIRLALVAVTLTNAGDFPPPTDSEIASAFAAAFAGATVEVVRHEPAEAPLGAGPTTEADGQTPE